MQRAKSRHAKEEEMNFVEKVIDDLSRPMYRFLFGEEKEEEKAKGKS